MSRPLLINILSLTASGTRGSEHFTFTSSLFDCKPWCKNNRSCSSSERIRAPNTCHQNHLHFPTTVQHFFKLLSLYLVILILALQYSFQTQRILENLQRFFYNITQSELVHFFQQTNDLLINTLSFCFIFLTTRVSSLLYIPLPLDFYF